MQVGITRLVLVFFLGAGGTLPALADVPVATSPLPFAQVVKEYFHQWDKNGDGTLAKAEIDAAVLNPAFHQEPAAAIAAIKLVVRGGKYTLPPITETYLINSPLRESTNTLVSTERLDDPTSPKQVGRTPAFQTRYRTALSKLKRTSRELFPQNLPVLESCRQGPLGDCYFVSVVGAMIHRDPAAVKKMFTQNTDGTTTVTFGRGQSVKTDALSDGEIAISSVASTNGLWLTVLENAFGQYRARTSTNSALDAPDTDVIAHGGKPSYVITALDGYKTKYYNFRLPKGQRQSAQFPTNMLSDLSAALQAHRLVATSTTTNTLPPGINGKHAYAILDYDRTNATVRLWNPHGNTFKPKGPEGLKYGYTTKAGRFDLPVKDWLASYKSVTIETAMADK